MGNVKSVAGLGLIGAAILSLDTTKIFPGWWAILPTAGGFLVISAGPEAWLNRWLLASRPMVWVGLISYPLYLWHWPLLSFCRIVQAQEPSAQTRGVAIFASLVLASLTYLFVEKPIRFGKAAGKTFVPLIVVMGVIGAAGYYTYREAGFPGRHAGVEDILAAAKDFDYEGPNGTFHGVPALVLGNPTADATVFLGDSTIQQYIPRVRALADRSRS
jgi:hypothetical protein